jgi:sentrin-specific protease 1
MTPTDCTHRRYTKAILRYLNDDSMDKRKHSIEVEDWETGATGRGGAPQQENGFDCGMFSAMYADFISDDLPFDFDQSHISGFRRKAVADILRGELNYIVS